MWCPAFAAFINEKSLASWHCWSMWRSGEDVIKTRRRETAEIAAIIEWFGLGELFLDFRNNMGNE